MAKDRDKELDEVERALKDKGRPFVQRPDHLDIGKGSLCWGDGTRLCGPDCVAFNPEQGLDPSGVVIDHPNKCLFLMYAGQQGSSALSQIHLNKSLLRKMQDDVRITGPADMPPPVGGKKP